MGGVAQRDSISATAFLNLRSPFGLFVSAFKNPFRGNGDRGSKRTYRQWQCLSVIVKIPERPRNPDFHASEGALFICLRACGSFQRNTLRIVIGLAMFTREA